MTPKKIADQVVKQTPELKTFSPRQLRLVKKMIVRAIDLSSNDILSPEETAALMKKYVPDSGTPAAALRGYRGREELTQRELAKKCGIPQPHIAAMESGKRPIGLAIAKKLALALNCNYKRLV